ncbi:uncharacterized protein LOC136712428 [Amia ocellicauda]|uniref:uncharacterized protein LOC136712428 n=1 Tax=Amia ocellicauda TaxID=2972642 RepID=UPI003464C300
MSRLLPVLLLTAGALLDPTEGQSPLHQQRAVDAIIKHFNGMNKLKKTFLLHAESGVSGDTVPEAGGTFHSLDIFVKETDCPHDVPSTQDCKVLPRGALRVCKACFTVTDPEDFHSAKRYIDCTPVRVMNKRRQDHAAQECKRLHESIKVSDHPPRVSVYWVHEPYRSGIFHSLQESASHPEPVPHFEGFKIDTSAPPPSQ